MSKNIFIFSGEGAKGAYQAEIARRLIEEYKIIPEELYGISSGAVNAAAFAHADPGQVVALWQSVKSISQVFRFSLMATIFGRGLFTADPLYNLLKANMGPARYLAKVGYIYLPESEVKYASNLAWPRKEFIHFVTAAGCIPGLVDPWGDKVDGGGIDLLPLDSIEPNDNAYIILGQPLQKQAINCDWKFFKFAEMYAAFFGGLMHEVLINDYERLVGNSLGNVTLISPLSDIGSPLQFNRCAEFIDIARTQELAP